MPSQRSGRTLKPRTPPNQLLDSISRSKMFMPRTRQSLGPDRRRLYSKLTAHTTDTASECGDELPLSGLRIASARFFEELRATWESRSLPPLMMGFFLGALAEFRSR